MFKGRRRSREGFPDRAGRSLSGDERGNTVQLLLARGADPHHRNRYRKSPAMVAGVIANYDYQRFFREA